MPLPVRTLPVIQQWDCHNCGDCCTSYEITISEVEAAKIESQGWDQQTDLGGRVPFVTDRKGRKQLNHDEHERCVFLSADNRCKIHAKFGAAAKPLACRVYPFILVPAGDHWRVSLRLACPSALHNQGRALTAHTADLSDFAKQLEADTNGPMLTSGAESLPAPELSRGHSVPYADLQRFLVAFLNLLKPADEPIEYRLRQMIALAAICRKSRFDTTRGSRLSEFLSVVSAAVTDDVPKHARSVPGPSRAARMIFRQIVAIYSRRDRGRHPGIASRGRWTRLLIGLRFALGRGTVPQLHGLFGPATFHAAFQPVGRMSNETETLLARFYQLKLESMQFCGPTNFHRTFWTGFDSLMLTFPVICWMANVYAARPGCPREEAFARAVQQVDDSFGFNPLLGTSHQTWAIETLSHRDELTRLIAWYSRESA